MDDRRIEELATGRPGALLVKYAWPALVAMSLHALYAVVDRFYIGKGCGVEAMAGLQLAMPAMMLLTAFGPLIGVGHAAVLSIKLGEGDRETCERLVGQTVALKLLLYAVLIPLLYVFIDQLLDCCGADKVVPEARAAAKSYLQIVLFSHIFSHVAFGLSALMRAEGSATRSMMCMVAGFGVNLVLDPILIFVFDMGLDGAAWATDVAMFASCAFALSHYWSGHSAVKLRLRRIRLYPALLGRTLAIGLAPFLQQLMGAAVVASLQLAFAHWLADDSAVTDEIVSLGVYQSLLVVAIMPIMGAQQGLQPIIGYNWGARRFRRVRETLVLGFWVTTALCVVATVLQAVPPFPRLMTWLFIPKDKAALVSLAAHDLQAGNCMLWCIGLNIVSTTYFQSIGHPATAIVLSLLRQGICFIPAMWILPRFIDDSALAIWLSMPVSDVLCCLMTILPISLHLRFLSRVRDRDAPRAPAS